MGRTFYDVLDVAEDAEKAEVRRTYRAMAKEHHPDVSDDPEAGERFKRINQAAEVLGDPAERKRYDRLGHDAYVAAEDGIEDWDIEASPNAEGPTSRAGPTGTATTGGSGGSAADGTAGAASATDSGPSGPWGQSVGNTSGSGTGTTNSGADWAGRDTNGPGTGFRDTGGSRTASSGGTIGANTGRDPERTARWERAHDPDAAGREQARRAWEQAPQAPRRNTWVIALSMLGSGRIVDQWSAFRRGLLLVYLYPVLLVVLLAGITPVLTILAAAVTVLVAIYASGIPNVGTLVFGLLGGLITVFLVNSPYALSAPTARVLLAACWIPLGHSVLVAWLIHRGRR